MCHQLADMLNPVKAKLTRLKGKQKKSWGYAVTLNTNQSGKLYSIERYWDGKRIMFS